MQHHRCMHALFFLISVWSFLHKVHKYTNRALKNDFRPRLSGHAEWNMNLQTYDQIFDSHLRVKVMALWSFFIGLYVEAMHLQCFPPTLRECALFRKRILLDHLLTEYGPGCSTWFLDFFFLLSVVRCLKKKRRGAKLLVLTSPVSLCECAAVCNGAVVMNLIKV